jgi:septal ring factor EnvC (AmiA/AmiB activator)
MISKERFFARRESKLDIQLSNLDSAIEAKEKEFAAIRAAELKKAEENIKAEAEKVRKLIADERKRKANNERSKAKQLDWANNFLASPKVLQEPATEGTYVTLKPGFQVKLRPGMTIEMLKKKFGII